MKNIIKEVSVFQKGLLDLMETSKFYKKKKLILEMKKT